MRVEQLEDRSVPAFTFTPNSFGGGNFTPFDNFTGQVWSASGDVNGDGVADIIVAEGAGAGSTSEVRIFDGAAARAGRAVLVADFYAYSDVAGASQTPGFAGGVRVAAADFNGDGYAEVVTAAGDGGNGHVKVFDFRNPGTGQFLGSNPTLETSYFAYPGFLGPTSVATLNRNGQPPLLVTASGAGTTAADVRAYADPLAGGTSVTPVAQMFAFSGFLGGVSIAAGDTTGTGTNELFVSPDSGSPVVSTFTLGAGAGGGMTFEPGITFSTGTGTETGVSLGAADIDGTGATDVLTTSSGSSTISAFSLSTGSAVSVAGLNGFTGYGFFGGTFLAAGNFFGPAFAGGTSAAAAGATTEGVSPGTTSAPTSTTSTGPATGTTSGTAANPGTNTPANSGTGSGTSGSGTATNTGTASSTQSSSATNPTTT